MKNRDVHRIQELLRQQKETVIQKRRELEKIERKIENRLRQIEDAVSSELDVIHFVTYTARRITWIRKPLSIGSYLDLEVPIRQLEDKQKEMISQRKSVLDSRRHELIAEKLKEMDPKYHAIVSFDATDFNDPHTVRDE